MPPPTRPDHRQQSDWSPADDPRNLWISAEAAKNRIILRTVAGGAKYAATLIDHMALPEVLGTIAGNDSVAIICADEKDTSKVLTQLKEGYLQAEQALTSRRTTHLTDGPR
ncbi:hypothetical protein [Actinomyces sp.]|uniref:hypothetical protein n=1 Tax=Actinomyces sp. TaxID=29317 RepID=UPI0026DBB711|nr:hypothetical protein [Actinomyces sp.]MDO4900470.1 hypothetical protein [Actinomyces sp.]